MENALPIIQNLRPVDMSVVMLAFALVDIWTALSLSVKAKSTLSKSLIKGFLFNLLVIMLPFCLNAIKHMAFLEPDGADFGYIHVISVLITFLYLASTAGSIISNYSAAYPESKNVITKLAYRYLPAEVNEKQQKHGIDNIKGA